jgi:HlyD family secretion protein
MLDAVESGRVEAVAARDGALVEAGQVLFQLSNPQRRLELLERESERAQQLSNALNLRVSLEAAQAERQRRLSDLQYTLTQATRAHARNEALARQGFMSAAALEDSGDRLAQQRRLVADEQASHASASRIQRDALTQMQQAIARMEKGLELVNATVAALAVRAPVAGRLTDFHLQIGETVQGGQHLGRIDSPAQFKLSAQVDEFYLNRLAPGRKGTALIGVQQHPLTVSRIYRQVKDGRFTLELGFDRAPPDTLQPGQSMEVAITLGESRRALVLPMDGWVGDSSGLWAYVLNADGVHAERRLLRTGRRTNTQVEVLAGVAPGERVIVSSYAGFGNAARLELAP